MTTIIYENLKNEMETEGITIEDIAGVFNTSEDEIKKILSDEEQLDALYAHKIMVNIFPGTDMNYLFFNHKENYLKDLVSNLDNEMGGISLKIEDLKSIEWVLGQTIGDMEEVDQSDLTSMGLTFRERFIQH